MLNLILTLVLYPLKAFFAYLLRTCLKDELGRLDQLQDRIKNYESRIRQANEDAAAQETTIEKLTERIVRQNEELDRLQGRLRQEVVLQPHDSQRSYLEVG